MKNKYFNYLRYKKAENLIETNPFVAKDAFEDYIERYPEDYNALFMYSYVLLILKDLEGAKKVVEEAKALYTCDTHFFRTNEKKEWADFNYKMSNLRILAREKKYQELKDYYDEIKYTHSFHQMELIEDICRIKLGEDIDISKKPYYLKQLRSYSEDSFYYHILRHTADYNAKLTRPKTSFFSPDFDLEKVIEEIKRIIPNKKGLAYGFFEDTYVFKYDGCGRYNNKVQDYFKLICLSDNSSFITMYPSINLDKMPNIDLNYINNKEDKIIITISQIDKFNKKYKLS